MWCELSVWCCVEMDLCCVETRWRDRTHGWTCHVLANSDWKVWQLHRPMWLSSLSPSLSPPSLPPSLPPLTAPIVRGVWMQIMCSEPCRQLSIILSPSTLTMTRGWSSRLRYTMVPWLTTASMYVDVCCCYCGYSYWKVWGSTAELSEGWGCDFETFRRWSPSTGLVHAGTYIHCTKYCQILRLKFFLHEKICSWHPKL